MDSSWSHLRAESSCISDNRRSNFPSSLTSPLLFTTFEDNGGSTLAAGRGTSCEVGAVTVTLSWIWVGGGRGEGDGDCSGLKGCSSGLEALLSVAFTLPLCIEAGTGVEGRGRAGDCSIEGGLTEGGEGGLGAGV